MRTLIALLFAVNMLNAGSPDYINTYYYNPSITINFNNWQAGLLNVTIHSTESNEVVFKDKVSTNNSEGIKYNLKNLEYGKYIVTLENDLKIVKETIILFDGKIVEKDSYVTYKPVIIENESDIKVNFLSPNKDVKVTISDKNRVIFKETFENENTFNKVFNTEKLEYGNYSINVSNGHVSNNLNFKK